MVLERQRLVVLLGHAAAVVRHLKQLGAVLFKPDLRRRQQPGGRGMTGRWARSSIAQRDRGRRALQGREAAHGCCRGVQGLKEIAGQATSTNTLGIAACHAGEGQAAGQRARRRPVCRPSSLRRRASGLPTARPHLDRGRPCVQRVLHQLLHSGGQVQDDLQRGGDSTASPASQSSCPVRASSWSRPSAHNPALL